MVGSSKTKSKPVKFIGLQRSVTHNSGQQGRRQKALLKKKYYLDIKNDCARRKLEKSLISLGATIEVFFDPCVNAVVTDREQLLASLGNNSGPSPSPNPSLSSVYSLSGGEQAPRKNKTRLDTILEHARLQPQHHVRDPLDDAKKYGVPIYSLVKFCQFLERFEAAQKKEQLVKSKELKGHFIKLEHCDRNHQPVCGEFKKWTFINLDTRPGDSPFDPPRPKKREVSEEADTSSVDILPPDCKRPAKVAPNRFGGVCRPNGKKVKSRSRMTRPKLPGYCEMCNVHYSSQRSHVLCESHVNAQADTSYLALDALISRGPDMDAFVKLNALNSGGGYHRRRSLRGCERGPPMSPHTANGGPRKRSKAAGARTRSMSGGQLYLPSGLLGTTAEDVGNPARTVQPNNSMVPSHASGGVARKRTPNDRPSSADEAPTRPEMNGVGGGGCRRRLLAKRRSQLAVLSDEAQNFMFREPPPGQSSSDEEEEDSSSRVSVKIELDSNSLDSQGQRRKKRRSQAEAFIEDNREYYKFETPSSRLRFHERDGESVHKDSACGGETNCDRDRDDNGCCKHECAAVKKEGGCFVKREEAEGEYRFSFERVPRSEPWYQTFRRQDLGEEFYYSLPSAADEPFLLPYQLPPPRLLHPLPPGTCRRGGRARRLADGRLRHLADRRPRKSPRCHASTLAILSGFIQRRTRDSSRGGEGADPPPPPPPPLPAVSPPTRPRGRPRRTLPEQPPPPTHENHQEKPPDWSEAEGDLAKLARVLDEMLDMSGYEDLDAPTNPEQLVPLDRPAPGVLVPVASLMQDRCECCVLPPAPSRHSKWQTRKRKKRFNMTGWPDARKKSRPLGPGERLRRLRAKEERTRELSHEPLNDGGSSCYTDCDGISETAERGEEEFGEESVDSEEQALSHFTRGGLPDDCVPSTRKLRSAGTPLPRRESPRKTNRSARESVS